VAGRPGRDPSIGDFDTQVAELGIACEACHGPAEAHVERHRNPVTRFAQHLSQALDPTIVNPKRLDAAHGSMICGQCHAYFVPLQESEWWKNGFAALYRAGQGLDGSRHMLDYFSDRETPAPNEAPLSGPPILSTSFESVFWPDGTIRVGGREYNGLLLSPCFQRGQGRRKLDCLSCHSMHQSQPDDQLASRMEGNRACVQCHTEFSTRLSRHTHHQTESSGSLCYNCHMPYTTYALFKGIRSHRIDSPRASSVSERDRPNACNLCHLDRTLGWARRYLMDWYRQPSREPDDPEAVVEPEADTVAASVLWLLRGDAATRVVVAQSYGWSSAQRASGRDWQAPLLAELLVDPYSAVRWVAHQSLSTLPGFEGFEYDFIAPNDDLHKARELALHRSSELGRSKASKELLQNARGELDRSAVRRLLSERDDRPVTIAE
jgi:predicted CXXCH cytochrome family protein